MVVFERQEKMEVYGSKNTVFPFQSMCMCISSPVSCHVSSPHSSPVSSPDSSLVYSSRSHALGLRSRSWASGISLAASNVKFLNSSTKVTRNALKEIAISHSDTALKRIA